MIPLFCEDNTDFTLLCYCDWAWYKKTRRFTGGLCTLLSSKIISWSLKRYGIVYKSSTETD